MSHHYILGLGSNIDPQSNIEKAKSLLSHRFTILKESRFIQTAPIGADNQPHFLNGTLLIESDLTADQIRLIIKEIEEKLGRKTTPGVKSFGPRTIDIDILTEDNNVIHRDFYSRDFVKDLVLEISPSIRF